MGVVEVASGPAVPAAAEAEVMALRATLARREHEIEHLLVALQSRDVIGQAKGILMERRRITPGEAFDVLLRDASQRLNVKVTVVASHLTATGELL